MTRTFDVVAGGAVGNGQVNCWAAFQSAIDKAAKSGGKVYVPPGEYRIEKPLIARGVKRSIALVGDGAGVSVLVCGFPGNLLRMHFEQVGARQPAGLLVEGVGFHAIGSCLTAIKVSYGAPEVTIDHRERSVVIRNVDVVSDDDGNWTYGIVIESAWNVSISDVFVSGFDGAGNWNAMMGAGISLQRLCVNAHLSNVRCCNFAVGIDYDAMGGKNTEGIFCSNCSMVAVKRGVWLRGNGNAEAARVSTFTWHGGMIEARVRGVNTGSAAFHLDRVWTALIGGCQMLADTLDSEGVTYGVFAEHCHGVVVKGCCINAWHKGVWAQGSSRAILSSGNTFTNCAQQTYFGPDVVRSRSFGHVLVGDKPNEINEGAENLIGFH